MLFTKGLNPRLSNNYSNKKEVSRHIINKKANAKLDYVVEKYKVALGGYVNKTRDRFLEKDIIFDGLRFIDTLNLKYKIENRLWAISYDLIYKTSVEDTEKAGPEMDCAFNVKLKGKIKIGQAEFYADTSDQRVDDILEKLNNQMILDRITSMDITNFKIFYRVDTGLWTISCKSLIGSTTWNFIPPITYLIKPEEEECVKVVELFELVSDALVRP